MDSIKSGGFSTLRTGRKSIPMPSPPSLPFITQLHMHHQTW